MAKKNQKDCGRYSKYMAETNLGLMFNIKTPWNSSKDEMKPGNCNWIRAEDIIGVETIRGEYYLRVKYRVGGSSLSVDSITEVTQDAFKMVCWYFDIPCDL